MAEKLYINDHQFVINVLSYIGVLLFGVQQVPWIQSQEQVYRSDARMKTQLSPTQNREATGRTVVRPACVPCGVIEVVSREMCVKIDVNDAMVHLDLHFPKAT